MVEYRCDLPHRLAYKIKFVLRFPNRLKIALLVFLTAVLGFELECNIRHSSIEQEEIRGARAHAEFAQLPGDGNVPMSAIRDM